MKGEVTDYYNEEQKEDQRDTRKSIVRVHVLLCNYTEPQSQSVYASLRAAYAKTCMLPS